MYFSSQVKRKLLLVSCAEAFACLMKAADIYVEMGRFTMAAKHFKARVLQSERSL